MPHPTKGNVMSEATTEPTTTAPVTESSAKADEKLGEAGLAALKAEREARAAAEKRVKEFEDRDKTEAEKLAARLAEVEQREAKALRAEVAAAKGVPASLLNGSTKAELEAHADALITFRGEKQATGLVVPKEGSTSTPKPSNEREFVKQLFGSKGD